MKKTLLITLFTVSLLQGHSQSAIVTIAGNGTQGYSGDGGPAISSLLKYPTGVVCDHLGNTYLCDANHTVRKIDASGIITHVATVYDPIAMACDKQNNIYVISQNYQSVFKITPSGTKTLFAGTGQGSASYSGDGGPATAATLNYPYGIAVDTAGNVLIATTGDARIRKVNTAGIISTICGHGNTVTNSSQLGDGGPATLADLASPRGLAIDKANNLYIMQQIGSVRMIDAAGIIHTFAGDPTLGTGYSGDGGPATSAQFNSPLYMTFDTTGNMYIADLANYVIRKIDINGIVKTCAGTYHAWQSWPNQWQGAYSGDGGDPLFCELNQTWGVSVNTANELVIADYGNHAIRKIVSTAGFDEIDQEKLFSVYPNPANGVFHLKQDAESKVVISNNLGQEIISQTLQAGDHTIDLIDQAPGIYFIKVRRDNHQQIVKLINYN